MTRHKIARYGWIPDLPDHRDWVYAAPRAVLRKLPAKVDLRVQCPSVYDQGQIGSCTANAIGAAIEFDRLRQKLPDFIPSRLFLYYNERVIEGTVEYDSGAYLRDGIKSVASQGDCPESLWPYDGSPFPGNPRLTRKPSARCYERAEAYRVVQYERLTPVLEQLKGCLASGFPFVFGFTVYESFESQQVAKTGHAPLPGRSERAVGGHAVVAVGYEEARRWFVVRNSWGTEWGMKGYFTLPYGYLTDRNLSDDFWTIRLVK